MSRHQQSPTTLFSAIVMAADRNPDDPVARAAGVPCKALAPVAGTPMVLRVLDALEKSREVRSRLLCGPPWALLAQAEALRSGIEAGRYGWTESRGSPSASAAAAMQQVPPSQPVLLTTADHALLTSRVVDHFCAQAHVAEFDLVVALAPYDLIAAAYPNVKRTRLRFSDREYCSCNLFAFITPRARAITGLWRKVEGQRKRPWRVIGILGWWSVLEYLLRRLPLQQALGRLSRRLGMRIGAVIMPFPEAAVDVDSEGDWQLVQQILAEKEKPQAVVQPGASRDGKPPVI